MNGRGRAQMTELALAQLDIAAFQLDRPIVFFVTIYPNSCDSLSTLTVSIFQYHKDSICHWVRRLLCSPQRVLLERGLC
jgi:hypothetical protein